MPAANLLIVVVGLFCTLAILRKPLWMFFFVLMCIFGSLAIVVYEYLYTYDFTYLLASSIILLLTLVFAIYSRMAAMNQSVDEKFVIPEIEWPKPEPY